MERTIYESHGWKAIYEKDTEDEGGADRVWIEKRGELLGTFEAVDVQMPDELVEAVERFYEEGAE